MSSCYTQHPLTHQVTQRHLELCSSTHLENGQGKSPRRSKPRHRHSSREADHTQGVRGSQTQPQSTMTNCYEATHSKVPTFQSHIIIYLIISCLRGNVLCIHIHLSHNHSYILTSQAITHIVYLIHNVKYKLQFDTVKDRQSNTILHVTHPFSRQKYCSMYGFILSKCPVKLC